MNLKKWSLLKRECDEFDYLTENKGNIPRFKRTREKVYFRLSKELWKQFQGRTGYINLNEIIENKGFHRAKSIRIIRKWQSLGMVDILDRTKENQNLITYFVKVNLKTKSLPHLFYMYSRAEYLTKKTTKGRKPK